MQSVNILIHQVVGLVFPASYHGEVSGIHEQMLFAGLNVNLPTGHSDN
jgi:hypothetical protein